MKNKKKKKKKKNVADDWRETRLRVYRYSLSEQDAVHAKLEWFNCLLPLQ